MNLSSQISRRAFVGTAAAGAAGLLLSSCNEPAAPVNTIEKATLKSRPSTPTQPITSGMHPLGLDPVRDGFIYVPPSYNPAVAAPLLILLHGAGRSSADWASAAPILADERGIIILAPDSARVTWDRIYLGSFGPDVSFIDAALQVVFTKCRIDPAQMAIGGFSDGASYALSLGLPNGDMFGEIIAFSPGFSAHPGTRGKPRIFISHGVNDTVLPINYTSREIVPALRALGYTVEYTEFDGGHIIPPEIGQAAMEWWIPGSA